jgi:hypothetical protein
MKLPKIMSLRNSRKFIIFYVFYLVVCLEILARMFLAMPAVFNFMVPLRLECDAARRLRWMDKYTHSKKALESGCARYNTTRGWALKQNVHNMRVYGNKVLNTNTKGIRGKIEYSHDKHPEKTRILILGDSFTFGDQVSDNETYPFYLQQILPNTEIINFGIPGYGHDQMLIYLQEEGVQYKPDIVILGFITADISRNMLTFRDYAKPKFNTVNGRLTVVNSPVPSPQEVVATEFYKPKLLDLLHIVYCKVMLKTKFYHKTENKVTEALLDEMSATIKRMHATPVFVFLDAQRNIETSPAFNSDEIKFISFCQHSGVTHKIFLRPYFADAAKNGVSLKTIRHFNPQENKIVAQGIADYLLAHQLINTNN